MWNAGRLAASIAGVAVRVQRPAKSSVFGLDGTRFASPGLTHR